jgi:hypothetical protein
LADASQDQINEIEKAIQKALDLEKKGGEKNIDEAKKLRKKAIRLADKYYKLPKGNLKGEPEYDEREGGEGSTSPVGGKGVVKLGKDAFVWKGKPSAAWLASTKIHELHHSTQIQPDNTRKPDQPEREVESYNKELDAAKKTGLTKDMIEELKKRKRGEYDGLPEERKKVWRKKEPWLAEPEKKAPKLCQAYFYKGRETGAIFACDKDLGDNLKDFVKMGDGLYPCELVVHCAFS